MIIRYKENMWRVAHLAMIVLGSSLIGSCSRDTATVATSEEGAIEYIVDLTTPIASIQPTMYGIFFEDINFAADGGLYAEMVKNRSFEFTLPMMGWQQPNSDRWSNNANSGFATVLHESDKESNAKYVEIKVNAPKGYRLINEGFRGMGFKEGLRYDFSMMGKKIEGATAVHVELIDTSGQVLASDKIAIDSDDWTEYELSLVPSRTEMKGQLNLRFEGVGVVHLDMISLFPSDTWMNREKGLRADLVQLLADMDPGFLRFPGGCIVEGRTLARRYQWKKTVGDIEDRASLVNRWNTEFAHRPTPDYYQSFGLGFFEYFQLSEDLGAEPLPILSCGMACQFNTGELVPMDELDPYVQDALDLIEFANGDTDAPWGQIRADMGHPEPFDMKYIGIGNEQWGEEYIKRYEVFERAIKAQYPDMIIVSGSGPFPDGEMFDYGMSELSQRQAEIVDEHYYRTPEWFRENADRYDDYDREGPIIFAGEYAAQSVAIASPDNKNNWECALSEAAYMTGLERNADVVQLTSYAPLMAHADGWQWTPDLIWFNNLEAYGTPSYYVQKLFSTNRGSHVLFITDNGKNIIGQDDIYATAAKDESAGELIVKVVNTSNERQKIKMALQGATNLSGKGTITILKNNDKEAVNSFDAPENIYPVSSDISFSDSEIVMDAEPMSLTVLRFQNVIIN